MSVPLPRVPSARVVFLGVYLCVLAALIGVLMAACGPRASHAQAPGAGPPPVSVAPAARRMVEEFEEFSARLAAVEQVEVRARVAGTLQRVHFRDGQAVRKGDLLFTIDPRPFAAEAARAAASLASARTQAALAASESARAARLLPIQAISRQEADQLQAAADNAVSAVQAAQAALDSARLNLEFTRIAAPIAGRVSRTAVTAGNLVNANTDLLTTIVSTGRVYAYFDASEAAFLKYGRSGGPARRDAPPVRLGLFDEQGFPHAGRLDFVDNRLNPATGSMQLRAVFDNPDARFTPGLSARVRLSTGPPYEATVVPERAIATDQTRKVVLVVGPDRRVEARQVNAAALVDGMRVVQGVRPGEHIIVDGLQRAFPGAPVTPQLVPLDAHGVPLPPASPSPPPRG